VATSRGPGERSRAGGLRGDRRAMERRTDARLVAGHRHRVEAAIGRELGTARLGPHKQLDAQSTSIGASSRLITSRRNFAILASKAADMSANCSAWRARRRAGAGSVQGLLEGLRSVARNSKKQQRPILFVVIYEDGSTIHITLDQRTARAGDHVARIIAGELQRDRRIPEGKIISVSRMRLANG
jgi:hypothetical protein